MKQRRVAKYRRVSTKEQAIHGYSLQAQDETLNEFLESDFRTLYKSLKREEKRALWRSIIKKWLFMIMIILI